MKKNRKPIRATNAVESACSKNRDWGYIPVPSKGGKTTNAEIFEKKGKGE